MLPTPANHLPRYYPDGITWAPEWQKTESAKYAPIWQRAFDIHYLAHPWGSLHESHHFNRYAINPVEGVSIVQTKERTVVEKTPINATAYCDCYERAYQEFEKAGKLKELGIET